MIEICFCPTTPVFPLIPNDFEIFSIKTSLKNWGGEICFRGRIALLYTPLLKKYYCLQKIFNLIQCKPGPSTLPGGQAFCSKKKKACYYIFGFVLFGFFFSPTVFSPITFLGSQTSVKV